MRYRNNRLILPMEEPADYTGYIVLIIIGIIAVSLYSFHRYQLRAAIMFPMPYNYCQVCHFPQPAPIIKTPAQYTRIHRHKTTAKDREALEELKANEYLISQMIKE